MLGDEQRFPVIDDRFPVRDVYPEGLAGMLQDEFWGDGPEPAYDFDYWMERLSRSHAVVRLVHVDPVSLVENLKLKALAPYRVLEYVEMLDEGCNPPPVVIVAGDLVDGIHRTLAAAHVGCPAIPAILFVDAAEVRHLGEKLKRERR
jgi:hypothetical protein